jgi:hypothetical protein
MREVEGDPASETTIAVPSPEEAKREKFRDVYANIWIAVNSCDRIYGVCERVNYAHHTTTCQVGAD